MSYIFPSATINNVIYTALRWGQFPTITYTGGAVAGSEVVTVTDDPLTSANITVQIQSGVSTNLQIQTAIAQALGTSVDSLYAKDLVTVSIIGGHASDTATTQGPTSLTGASAIALTSSSPIKTTSLDFLNVSADIGGVSPLPSTTIFTPTVSGMYLLSFYGLATVSPSGADAAPNLYMSWTDERGAQTYFNFAGNLDMVFSDGPNSVTIPIYAVAGKPIWMRTSAGNYSGTVRWNFHFSVTNLM